MSHMNRQNHLTSTLSELRECQIPNLVEHGCIAGVGNSVHWNLGSIHCDQNEGGPKLGKGGVVLDESSGGQIVLVVIADLRKVRLSRWSSEGRTCMTHEPRAENKGAG